MLADAACTTTVVDVVGGGDTHCAALLEPTGEVLPSGQEVQDCSPVLVVNFPAAHSVQLEATIVAENVPSGQAMHSVAALSEYVPSPHS